ncbi:MAG: TetR/AcrR family transcriptional regulator [Phycisphaerales bacterium]|nr:TetR/AcrR family transcriptional regulator [Phycisphaerales bacterium]
MTRLPAAKRREQLLSTAARLFAEVGYARATTSEIARAAGVSEPIIYRHFRSKKELFVALIDESGRETISQWKRHLKGSEDPTDRLRRILGDNPMVQAAGRDAYRVMLQAITMIDDEEIRQAINRHMRALHEFLASEVVRAQQAHRFTTRFPAEAVAWLLLDIGLGFGVLVALGVRDSGAEAKQVRDVLSRVLTGPRPDARQNAGPSERGGEAPGPLGVAPAAPRVKTSARARASEGARAPRKARP